MLDLEELHLSLIEFVEVKAPDSISLFPVREQTNYLDYLGGIVFQDGLDLVTNGDSFINPLRFSEAEYESARDGVNKLFHLTKGECQNLSSDDVILLQKLVGAIKAILTYYEDTIALFDKMSSEFESPEKSAFAESFLKAHKRPYNGTAHYSLGLNAERCKRILDDTNPLIDRLQRIISPYVSGHAPTTVIGMDAKP